MQRQCIDCKKDLAGHSKPLRCQACAARQRYIDKHGAPPEIVKAICATCGAPIKDYASNRTIEGGKYFCSNACWHISRRSGKTKGQRDATYYRANADSVRSGANSYYAVNRVKILKQKSEAERAIKAEIISAYGGKCVCCGESTPEFMTIDHIHGDGAAHRREIGGGGRKLYAAIKAAGFPKDRFRLLCFNCNTARGFYGYCPHKPEDKSTVSHRPFNPGRKRIVP